MCKDCCLADEGRFNLVDRERRYCFFQEDWGTYDINRDIFNQGLPVELTLS
jgi:hypothetical protein